MQIACLFAGRRMPRAARPARDGLHGLDRALRHAAKGEHSRLDGNPPLSRLRPRGDGRAIEVGSPRRGLGSFPAERASLETAAPRRSSLLSLHLSSAPHGLLLRGSRAHGERPLVFRTLLVRESSIRRRSIPLWRSTLEAPESFRRRRSERADSCVLLFLLLHRNRRG